MERDFEYEREKPRRKKGGVLGKILMMFVGIVLGIAITVGSVVGVGYWAYNQPVGETVEKIDGAANTDIYDVLFGEDGILNASYADKKVQDLVRDVLSELNNVTDSSGTLQGLCQLSPKLDSLLTDLVNKAGDNYALDLDKNTLVNTSFSGLAGYFESALRSTALGDLLVSVGEDLSPLLCALCYGEEDVDYTLVNGKVEMIPPAQKTTLNDLFNVGADSDLFSRIPLATLFDNLDTNDSMMMSVLYGAENRYTVTTEEGKTKVKMNQVRYIKRDDGFYDDTDTRLDLQSTGTSDNGTTLLVFTDGTIEYARLNGDEALVYKDSDCTKPLYYKKMTVGDLQGDLMGTIETIYVKDALKVDASSPSVMIALAYGTEGEDYEIVSGKIQMINGKKPRTIGDLTKDSDDLINSIALKDALNITKDSPSVMIALAYGTEGVDYDVVGEEIVMKEGKKPRTIGDLTGSNGADLINEIKLKDALDITPSSHKILIAIAYGNDYHIDINGNLTGSTIRSIGDLTGDNSETVINGITLKDTLDITPSSHKILISLAYGSGYTIENGVISGGTPRTLGNLIENGEDLINEIALSDLISDDGSTLIRYLLYGKQGVHFDVVEGNVTMLQRRVAVLGSSVYNEYGEKLNGYTATATTFTDDKGVTYHLVDSALGTVKTSDGEATLYYVTDANNQDVLYKANTLGDLIKDNSIISNLTKRLTLLDVLGESVNDNKFLKHIQNVVIDDLPNAINDLAIQDVFADDIFNADGTLKGTWKYLLTNSTHCDLNGKDCTCDKPKYKLTEIDQLVTNMQQNVKASSLNTLKTDGILTFDNDFLGQDIIKKVTIMKVEHTVYNTTKTKIGELTVEEMVEYAQALMKVLSYVS